MQLPPMCSARSMTATRLPKYAAWAPPFSPAGPQPTTMRSKESHEVTNSSAEISNLDRLSAARRIVGEMERWAQKFLVGECWRSSMYEDPPPTPVSNLYIHSYLQLPLAFPRR